MNNVHIRATFIIKFAYHSATSGYSNNHHQAAIDNEQVGPITENTEAVAGRLCAVCGSQLHMTSKLIPILALPLFEMITYLSCTY